MRFLFGLPLLLIPVAAYNILIFLVGGPAGTEGAVYDMGSPLWEYVAPSGATVVFSTADVILAGGVLLLYLEIFKAIVTGKISAMDQLLSFVLMCVCIAELLMLTELATGTFAILTLMTIIDVIGGFVVRMRPTRRESAPAAPSGAAA